MNEKLLQDEIKRLELQNRILTNFVIQLKANNRTYENLVNELLCNLADIDNDRVLTFEEQNEDNNRKNN